MTDGAAAFPVPLSQRRLPGLAGIVPSGTDEMKLSPDGAALTNVPPGTFRWIIQDDGLCELLVIDAHLMPAKFVKFAKMAAQTFVFPTKDWSSVDELMCSPEDELAWTSGNWPPDSLAEDAVTARVPAGFF